MTVTVDFGSVLDGVTVNQETVAQLDLYSSDILQAVEGEIDRIGVSIDHDNFVVDVSDLLVSFIYDGAFDKTEYRNLERTLNTLGAVVINTLRDNNIPISTDDITHIIDQETPDNITTSKKEICHIRRQIDASEGGYTPPADPVAFLDRYVEVLGIGDDLRDGAAELIEQQDHSGQKPSVTASGAIWGAVLDGYACSDDLVQQDIADEAKVTDVSVRERAQEMTQTAG